MKTNKFVAFIAVLLVTLSFGVMVCSAAPADTDANWRVLYINAESNKITIQFENPQDGVARYDIKKYIELKEGTTEITDFTHAWQHINGLKNTNGESLGQYNHMAVITLPENLKYDTEYTLTLKAGYGCNDTYSDRRRSSDYTTKFKVVKLFEDDFTNTPISSAGGTLAPEACKWVRTIAGNQLREDLYDAEEKTARLHRMFPNVVGVENWRDYTISYTGISGDPQANGKYTSKEKVQLYSSNKVGFAKRYNGLGVDGGKQGGSLANVDNIAIEFQFNAAFSMTPRKNFNGTPATDEGYTELYGASFVLPTATNQEYSVKIEANTNYIRISKNNNISGVVHSANYTDGAPLFTTDPNSKDRMKNILITKIEFIEAEIPEELKISSVKTTDGTAITNSISGDISGEISVLNSFKTEKPIKVVVAAYETDGESLRFLDAQICTQTSAAASTETKVPFNLGKVSGADTVKIFVWDTLESLKAYESCKTYTYTPEPANQ